MILVGGQLLLQCCLCPQSAKLQRRHYSGVGTKKFLYHGTSPEHLSSWVVVYVVDCSRGEQATIQFGWANCSLQQEVATYIVPQLRPNAQHPVVGNG